MRFASKKVILIFERIMVVKKDFIQYTACILDSALEAQLQDVLKMSAVKCRFLKWNPENHPLQASDVPDGLILDFAVFQYYNARWSTENWKQLQALVILVDEEQVTKIKPEELPIQPEILFTPLRKTEARWRLANVLREEQQASENYYKKLFQDSANPRLILEKETLNILDANNAAMLLYGLDYKALLATSLPMLHSELLEELKAKAREVIHAEYKVLINLKFLVDKHSFRDLELVFTQVSLENDPAVSVEIHDITDRIKTDEIFYEQHEMLRSTLESIDDLFFTLNKDAEFIEFYQPAGSNHFSLTSDVFIGKRVDEVGFPDEVAAKYIETIQRVIEQDRSDQIDYYLEAFGAKLWYNAKISPRKNTFGMAEGVTVICRDVTKQKKTEEALIRARDFYLTLLSDFPGMIWKTNTLKRADYFNNTWLEFTGNNLETELHTDWVEKIHIDDITGFLSQILQVYKEKKSFQIEHRLRHKSGEYRWVINAGRPFYNLEGQFAGFIGSCYDITERKQAEALLKIQESAIESALEGILIIEASAEDFPVIYANRELAVTLRLDPKHIPGMKFMEIIGNPIDNSSRDVILKALRYQQNYKGEFACQDKQNQNQLSWRLLHIAPVKNNLNQATHFVAVLSDITESKTAEKTLLEKNVELQKTNEELDRFVYSTSHELRSPLMSVLGLINLLETEEDPEEQQNYTDMMKDTINRLDKILHNIIDYSRNSRMQVQHQSIDFQHLIRQSIENQRYLPGFEKVKFLIDVNDKYPFLSDPLRIGIIFNNFISNCLKYHNFQQDKPFVEIKVKTSPVNTLITISDNGKGISARHLPHLYDMFYRGTQESEGSGIGLYIVKEIIEKLKGDIEVYSTENKGTTFVIEFPVSDQG